MEIVVYMSISGELSWKMCASNRKKHIVSSLCHNLKPLSMLSQTIVPD